MSNKSNIFRFWNTTNVVYDDFLGRSFCFVPSPQLYLIGDRRANGLVYKLSSTAYDDAGDIQRLDWISGHLDWGIDQLKIVNDLIMQMRRGVADDETDVFGVYMYRDNHGPWSTEEELSLGAMGDTNSFLHLGNMGEHDTRQHRIVVTEAVPCTIMKILEEFDIGT